MSEVRPVLEAGEISMRFGHVIALERVSLAVRAGEVLCLLGDNGAGKSTLIRILSGVFRPTDGRVRVDGTEVRFASPRDAQRHGIATVHQDLGLIPLLPIWRNFFMGAEPARGRGPLRRLDVGHCRNVVREALAAMGLALRDPDAMVASLSGGERQCVAIARALHFGARVLILDEPTAALGVRQSAIVLREIARVAAGGTAVILITHQPQHALTAGQRFAVLRLGRVVADLPRDAVDVHRLIDLMGGADPAG
jgi:simple sugar transport system ATP-binding protein